MLRVRDAGKHEADDDGFGDDGDEDVRDEERQRPRAVVGGRVAIT